jgi:cyclic beta-1,2-glucan synthetase
VISRRGAGFWSDTSPIRADIFGPERLEHHALSLAAAQTVTLRDRRVPSLRGRLEDNGAALLTAYRAAARAVETGETITPAADWLLDNFHIVEAQLRQIRDDLPPGYYRNLPKLEEGHLAGYPRVLGLAWAYVAHTDSLLSGPFLLRYVQAYQTVQPLTIGELWAVAITLRIVLIENMRRLADEISNALTQRMAADALVDRVVAGGVSALAELHGRDIPDLMAAQIAKRLRGMDPAEMPLGPWLDQRLQARGLTVETVVATAQARQGASNVTMRNIVTSMRRMAEMDWADFFEAVSLVETRLRQSPEYAAMDFATRNDYRTAIEQLARGSSRDEMAVTEAAFALTEGAQDPGFALIGHGRPTLETALAYRAGLGQWLGRHRFGLGFYLACILVTSAPFLALALWATGRPAPGFILTAAFIAIEAGMALSHLVISRVISPKRLPALALKQGIPPELRTMVAVPVLLTGATDLTEMLQRLEVHHLSSIGGAVHYALLSDGPDADVESAPTDRALISAAQAGIARLNATYPSDTGDRFLLLHRHRRWNAAEHVWMGWERKRGKLTELNALLRGATDTSFLAGSHVPQDVRFVVTLDADTRLLRDTLRSLIGKMAHPLNRPVLDQSRQQVTAGYGLLQPQVTPLMPHGAEGSAYQRITTAPGGMEPYAAARSDIYQDLFAEGSFTGKGIYDVDAFAAAMAGRVPENTLLSHDLFEGAFARAGLASDIQVIEDCPTRYDVDARRHHRWVRGDWQLLPWILGTRTTRGGISALNRWKMVDNLRRSLLAPVTLAALTLGWMQPFGMGLVCTLVILGLTAVPVLIGLPLAVLPGRAGVTSRSHFQALWGDTTTGLARFGLGLILLADTTASRLDAIARSLVRMQSGRHLLEWTTAAQSLGSGVPSLGQHYRLGLPGLGLGLAACALPTALNPAIWPLTTVFALLFGVAPAVAWLAGQPRAAYAQVALTDDQTRDLRLIARRTWRYFETFVTEDTNFLPPDNYQETPHPVVARRTSPTNIGLYLLSVTTAVEMGWLGQAEAVTRIEQTLATLQKMPRFRGHLYNWYDINDLRVLGPAYVSTVDSGNLAGHLIAVAQACLRWQHPSVPDRSGVQDAHALAVAALKTAPDAQLSTLLDKAAAHPGMAAEAAERARALTGPDSELSWWTGAMAACHQNQLAEPAAPERVKAVAHLARTLALEMDFTFLLQPDKHLLSIGFEVATNTLDTNCYDLLASEAQLASLFAIAKGDVETRHWFQLGRAATPLGAGSALISWSGSMFEYLMPALVLQTPEGSVIEETNRRVVALQQSYGRSLGLPWGISESSYNARDLEMTYQYSNFGVPGLGLKRGLGENQVVSPYATGLAAMLDPHGAWHNFAVLRKLGGEGRFGFYEALDFTPTRLPEGVTHAVVQSFMAHHQGMTIVALANVILGGTAQQDFHADPMIQSVDPLLQEHIPRDVSLAPPRAREVRAAPEVQISPDVLRQFDHPEESAPTAHLISNGRYGVVLTPGGAGFSRWGDLAITRWRADPTQSRQGSFIFLRDVKSGGLWSATQRPLAPDNHPHAAVFSEHHAVFTHRTRLLTTRTEVVVSAEDDAEARRVTLTNTGRHAREIDVTSYTELVLAPPASDQSHPAFSKMFVVTDYLPELGVLIATRRKRSPSDADIWAAHIAVVEGTETAPLQFETDRARFIGRGSDLSGVMMDKPLSGTTGTVLDPVFSLRRRITIPGGGRARVTFWTLVAASPEALLDLVERHLDPSAFGRAITLSWTQSKVQLRHLGLTSARAAEFQRLAGMVIRADPRLRARPAQIKAGAGPQSDLWALGISGDLPIVLFLISEAEDIARLTEVLAAVEYWRTKLLAVDLVILNDRSSSYVQDLQNAVEAAARRIPPSVGKGGSVYILRADLTTPEARRALVAAAAVVLVANRGGIGAQLDLLARPVALPETIRPTPLPPTAVPLPALELFNGTGGFADDGRTYVTILRDGQTTPAPWVNVVANAGFGFHVSAEGSGCTWAENARENQLTPWSNDPVSDPPGEAIYLQDMESGQTWTPTALPIRTKGTYIARHGFGYSSFQHSANGIRADMTQFVPRNDAVKITRLRLVNTGTRTRTLSVTAYAEWVLGANRSPAVLTEVDEATGAILARNPRAMGFPGRVAFADLGPEVTSLTCDRAEVIGRLGSMASPARLTGLSGRSGPGIDPCAALQRRIVLAPGQKTEVLFLLGQAPSVETARDLILSTRAKDPETELAAVKGKWADLLTEVQVKTPHRAMDILLNGWLLYQTLACRIWARAGFYQASGAYGFRDQLQDGMALAALRPELTRAHLLRAASRQFPEGDVQHWWLPHSGQGVRTRISDDRVWLGHCVAQYVSVSGDTSVLTEMVPFIEGPPLPEGEADAFYTPEISDQTATLLEHCARGLDQAVAMTGANGMPLIGTGDWNDGMNRVGEKGQGTSVWLGWLLIQTLQSMAPLIAAQDPAKAEAWLAHAEKVRLAIEADAWDGAWYRRGTYDDGSLLGSHTSTECQIDSIAQSWSVLSGAGAPARATQAMGSMRERLILPDMALLFTPPFDKGAGDPGYIKGYPPGLRENGGQYSHAAMWAILAEARLGNGDAAADLFARLNPINHALTPEDAQRYKVEPYVVAADVYNAPGHQGRGGWTWYTGSAAWMLRAGVEGILGMTRKGNLLHFDPCLPKAWPRVELHLRLGPQPCNVTILNTGGTGHGVTSAKLNGHDLPCDGGFALPLTDLAGELVLHL